MKIQSQNNLSLAQLSSESDLTKFDSTTGQSSGANSETVLDHLESEYESKHEWNALNSNHFFESGKAFQNSGRMPPEGVDINIVGDNVGVWGTSNDDSVRVKGDDVFVTAEAGDDYVLVEGDAHKIVTGAGNDTVVAGGTNSAVFTGDGDDLVGLFSDFTGFGDFSTPEAGWVDLGAGDDTVVVHGEGNRVFGGTGDDTMIQYYEEGSHGSKLFGEEGDDTFISYGDRGKYGFAYGQEGDDTFHVYGSNNSWGGSGNDTINIYNMTGQNTVWGGPPDSGYDVVNLDIPYTENTTFERGPWDSWDLQYGQSADDAQLRVDNVDRVNFSNGAFALYDVPSKTWTFYELEQAPMETDTDVG